MCKLQWFFAIVCLVCAGASQETQADVSAVNSVRGHGIWDLDHDFVINQISINAWRDESGVHGTAVWMSNYTDAEHGWIWHIRIDDMYYADEEQTLVVIDWTVEFDNRYPELEGLRSAFYIRDRGHGGDDTPDELSGYPILGGNFTVR